MRGDGIAVFVRATPKSQSDSIAGLHVDEKGKVSLKVRVRALPAKGKANAAVIATLAKALRLPKSSMRIVSGAGERNKTVLIEGNRDDIIERVDGLAAEAGRTGRQTNR